MRGISMIFMELNDDYSEKANYTFKNYPIYIQNGQLANYPDYTALAHWHDDIEMIYILSGEMEYNVNGKTVNLLKDEGIFINTKRMHFGFSSKKLDCDFICLRLHPLLLYNITSQKEFVFPLLNDGSFDFIHLNPDCKWQKEILDIIRLIDNEKTSKSAPLKIQAFFTLMWSLLFENITASEQKTVKNSDFDLLKNMIEYIHRKYHSKISLTDIANYGMVGQSKCCKLFSKYIGQTPNNYLINYRLQKSVDLLKNTDMPITEIALAVGFSGSSYFTETFKKQYGITPSIYRQNRPIVK